jgi:predicted cobalt transporter CbtA
LTRGQRVAFQVGVPLALAIGFALAFPGVLVFVEGAALNLRRFWWLVLIVAMGGWVAWTLSKRR